jgi:hypothetical protein
MRLNRVIDRIYSGNTIGTLIELVDMILRNN